MLNKYQMVNKQKDFIEEQKRLAKLYIDSLDKTAICTILLSGSVSRGDFFPGKLGGMIDLIIMVKDKESFDAESILGPDTHPFIPYYCPAPIIENKEVLFEIDIRNFITLDDFCNLDEARKYSLLESTIYFDKDNLYEKQLIDIIQQTAKEHKAYLHDTYEYGIKPLISEYMTDKWERREASIQLQQNLNDAIQMAVKCIYYINGLYTAPQNRLFYYTCHLQKLPDNYENLMTELMKQQLDSMDDYNRRVTLFKSTLIPFIDNYVYPPQKDPYLLPVRILRPHQK